MNTVITVKEVPGKESYEVRTEDGKFIGQATPEPDGEIAFSRYRNDWKHDAVSDNDLVNQITALIKEREITPSEE